MTTTPVTDLDRLAVDTVRTLAMDAVERAGSGHPGTAMALAPAAYVLWSRFLKFDPQAPDWADRDRFVLSNGHASILQYAVLHLTGYDLPLDELRDLRQWGSKTPGHPEVHHTPGVEVTTGPLGQGVAMSVGLAAAERFLAGRHNTAGRTLVNHRTWVFAGDGDIMEGVSSEASSIAGHLGLDRLTVVYDDNRITIDGPTDITLSEDVAARYAAYGWHVVDVADANDLDAIAAAYRAAVDETDRPTLIRLRTHIAWGAPNAQGTSAAHGAPLGADEIAATKRAYGWDPDGHFVVPDGVPARWQACVAANRAERTAWQARMDDLATADPARAEEFRQGRANALPDGWDADLDKLFADAKPQATRKASGAVLNALAPRVPLLLGGSADLASSNNTALKGEAEYTRDHPGRNLHFGVREHAMGAISNGLAAHGSGLRPYAATFLIFSDYLRPAVRLSALMRLPVTYVFTHDSVGLGGDGPTHQPVEQLPSLRTVPNLVVLRPADGPETAEAWRAALRRTDGPTALVLTRQNVPVIDRDEHAPADGLHRGGYVLAEAAGGAPRAVLLASGSEVGTALAARDLLQDGGVPTRVVSLPSWELFAAQPQAYRDEVLPPDVPARVAVEAAGPFGWERWVGERGTVVGVDTFGHSADGDRVLAEYGFTPEHVADRARALLA